jgi:hypothetical protein
VTSTPSSRGEQPRHVLDVVQDDEARNQMVVADHFELLMAQVLRDDAAIAEREALGERVVRLALVRRGMDRAPQIDAVDVAKQEDRPDGLPQFSEGEVELVLPAVRPEASKDGGWRELAQSD